jgi:hypothetical protein
MAIVLVFTCASLTAQRLLDFEGLQDLEFVQEFYNGGTGSMGSTYHTDLNISFSTNSQVLIDSDQGGNGNFGGEPSPDTALFFYETASVTMDVHDGFSFGISFYYTSPYDVPVVQIFDGPNGTGNGLAYDDLALTPGNGAPDPTGYFSPFEYWFIPFSGTAYSVVFTGPENQILFDDIYVGVPEPSTYILLGILGLLGYFFKRRKVQMN